jgi:polysaccharide biosynthesis transport protein
MPDTPPLSAQPKKIARPFNPISSLREHLIFVLIVFIAGSAVAVVAGAKKSRMTYEAQAVLNVMPTVPKILYTTEDTLRLRSYEDWMRTQITILSSHDILEAAILSYQARGFRWQRPDESMASAVTRLAAKLKVKQIRDTQLITLTMTSSVQKGLSDLINAVVESFIGSKRTSQEQEDSLKLKRLKEEKAKVQDALDESYQDLEKVSDMYGTAITEEKNLYVYINALSEMKKAQNDIYLKRISLENRMGALKEKAEKIRRLDLSPIIDEKVETDVLLRDNLVQLSRREQEIRTQMVGLKPDNPDYIYYQQMLSSLQAQAKRIRDMTRGREERLIRDTMLAENELAILDTRSEFLAVAETEAQLTEKIGKLQQEVLEFNTAVLRASTKRQDIERLQVSLNRINERMDQIMLEWANPGRISVVSWALPPDGGESNRMKLTLLGVLVSLALSCGIPIVTDFLNPVIRRPDDITKVLGFPPTGYIIASSADRVPPSDVHWIFQKHSDSYIYDLYMNIVLRFKKEHRAHGSTVFSVLALRDGNGASSFSMNALAALDANKDRKLYIDLNYRSPLRRRISLLESVDGLSEWAAQTGDIAPFVHVMPELPFHILPVGRQTDLLPTVLSISRMEGLLDTLRLRYDYIFIDGPPILASSFGAELASISDVAVLVPQADSSQWGELVFAATLLDRSGVQVVSVVPNQVPILKSGRFRESMNRFYSNREIFPSSGATTGMAFLKWIGRVQKGVLARIGGLGKGKGGRIALIVAAAALLGMAIWFGINRPSRVGGGGSGAKASGQPVIQNHIMRPAPSVASKAEETSKAEDEREEKEEVTETTNDTDADKSSKVGNEEAPEVVDEKTAPVEIAVTQTEPMSGTVETSEKNPLPAPVEAASVEAAATLSQEDFLSEAISPKPEDARPPALGNAIRTALDQSVLRKEKDTGAYFLQVSSMKSESAAREALASFQAEGVSGIVDRVYLKKNGEMFRVLIGPFASKADALRAQRDPEIIPALMTKDSGS